MRIACIRLTFSSLELLGFVPNVPSAFREDPRSSVILSGSM